MTINKIPAYASFTGCVPPVWAFYYATSKILEGVSKSRHVWEGQSKVQEHLSREPHHVFNKAFAVHGIAAYSKNPVPFVLSSRVIYNNAIPVDGTDGECWPGFLSGVLYRELRNLGYDGPMPDSFTTFGPRVTKRELEKIALDFLKALSEVNYDIVAKISKICQSRLQPGHWNIYSQLKQSQYFKIKKELLLFKKIFKVINENEYSSCEKLSCLSTKFMSIHDSGENKSFFQLLSMQHLFERNFVFEGLNWYSPGDELLYDCSLERTYIKRISDVYFNETLTERDKAENIFSLINEIPGDLEYLKERFFRIVAIKFKSVITRDMLEKFPDLLVVRSESLLKIVRKIFPEESFEGLFKTRFNHQLNRTRAISNNNSNYFSDLFYTVFVSALSGCAGYLIVEMIDTLANKGSSS